MEREDEEAGAEEGNTRYMVDFTKKLYEVASRYTYTHKSYCV